jgi:chromosome segregation protein
VRGRTTALAPPASRLGAATERINESDARITGAAERLARLNKELHTLANQRNIVAAQRTELEEVLERDRTALSELHGRGPDADESRRSTRAPTPPPSSSTRPSSSPGSASSRPGSGSSAPPSRCATSSCRRRRSVVRPRRSRRRSPRPRAGASSAVRGSSAAASWRWWPATPPRRSPGPSRPPRRPRPAPGRARRTSWELRGVREEASEAADGGRRAQGAPSRRRPAPAEVVNRLEQLTERLRADLSLSPRTSAPSTPRPTATTRRRCTSARTCSCASSGLLGRVNPLALEEFKALEERHAFLSDQLDDLRRSKRDLQEVVVAVDDRIREVFRQAFEDVAREFQLTFATVFPGGHGRLVLTEPDDLLVTGIEVEARPPGKKVTRLSLLSGGERSLTVLAFVFAIFRARPSPFYVLDEVDAALDDVNLQRLLRVVRSFRGHAQIIMVTHQKRSMEIADVLYGITMGPDAVTKVVAERLREERDKHDALEERASDAPDRGARGPAGAPSGA